MSGDGGLGPSVCGSCGWRRAASASNFGKPSMSCGRSGFLGGIAVLGGGMSGRGPGASPRADSVALAPSMARTASNARPRAPSAAVEVPASLAASFKLREASLTPCNNPTIVCPSDIAFFMFRISFRVFCRSDFNAFNVSLLNKRESLIAVAVEDSPIARVRAADAGGTLSIAACKSISLNFESAVERSAIAFSIASYAFFRAAASGEIGTFNSANLVCASLSADCASLRRWDSAGRRTAGEGKSRIILGKSSVRSVASSRSRNPPRLEASPWSRAASVRAAEEIPAASEAAVSASDRLLPVACTACLALLYAVHASTACLAASSGDRSTTPAAASAPAASALALAASTALAAVSDCLVARGPSSACAASCSARRPAPGFTPASGDGGLGGRVWASCGRSCDAVSCNEDWLSSSLGRAGGPWGGTGRAGRDRGGGGEGAAGNSDWVCLASTAAAAASCAFVCAVAASFANTLEFSSVGLRTLVNASLAPAAIIAIILRLFRTDKLFPNPASCCSRVPCRIT